jgi:predicted transcriptional regulator
MTRPLKRTAVLTIRISPEVKHALQAAADSERRSLANILEVPVLEYCDVHHLRLDDARELLKKKAPREKFGISDSSK